MAAAPESASCPTAPRCGPGGGARLGHASTLDDFASSACVRATGPALACRRRALETVEKVVTGPVGACGRCLLCWPA